MNPEILDLAVEDVRPYDVVDEGRFVITVKLMSHWNFARSGVWFADCDRAVQIESAVLVGVNEATGIPSVPYVVRPHQSDLGSTVYRFGTLVRVVRGMTPPIEPGPPDGDGEEK